MADLRTLFPRRLTIDSGTLANLATDLAKRAKDTEDVLKDYGLTVADFLELEQIPFFAQALTAARLEWERPLNTKQRCELGALTYTEKLLPKIAEAAEDTKQPLQARIDAARFIAKVGGLGEKEQSANDSQDRVIVQINLRPDSGKQVTEKYEKTIDASPTEAK